MSYDEYQDAMDLMDEETAAQEECCPACGAYVGPPPDVPTDDEQCPECGEDL